MKKVEVEIKVPYETRYLALIGKIGEDVVRTLRRMRGDREELAYQVNLVLTEAIANVIHHASNEPCCPHIRISIGVEDGNFVIRVFDEGQGFDMNSLPEPDFQSLEEGGRGVYLIRTVMDEVNYKPFENGYVMEMVKKLD
jgi:serine/threonine-protein kinase RsbW